VTIRALHVVAADQLRGAEVFASDLVCALGRDGVDQRVALVRGAPKPVLRFAAPTSALGREGASPVPGIRASRTAVRSLKRLIEEWRPDVVQVHGGEPLKHAVLAVRNGGPPVIYRRIGFAPSAATRGPRRSMHGWLMRRAARVVAVADALGRDTEETFRVPRERIVVIPNGVDPARLEPTRSRLDMRRSLGIPPGSRVVISLGALTPEKDPLAHLEVFRRVLERHHDARHLIVGEGPLRSQVESAIERWGVSGRVVLTGPRADVPDLLGASDAVLLASRSEGLPGCVIEGGMVGLPVAAYAVASVPGVGEVKVSVVWDPPWDPSRMSDEARVTLNMW